MIAFHGDREIKAKYLRRIRAHRAADRLIRGTGWDNGKGCAVGCTLENYDHSRYPIELGIPVELAYLEDCFFERLPKNAAMAWPVRFLSAAKVGADLSMVWERFAVWLLREELIERLHLGFDVASAVDDVATLYERRIAGDEPTATEWQTAWDAAEAAGAAAGAAGAAAGAAAEADAWAARADAWAARADAWAAAGADAWAAAWAARAAARAAAGAAGAAAWAAGAAAGADAWAAAWAARAASIKRQSDKLIELMAACKVTP